MLRALEAYQNILHDRADDLRQKMLIYEVKN